MRRLSLQLAALLVCTHLPSARGLAARPPPSAGRGGGRGRRSSTDRERHNWDAEDAELAAADRRRRRLPPRPTRGPDRGYGPPSAGSNDRGYGGRSNDRFDDGYAGSNNRGGYDSGYDSGYDGGYNRGYDSGYESGYGGGRDGGRDGGYEDDSYDRAPPSRRPVSRRPLPTWRSQTGSGSRKVDFFSSNTFEKLGATEEVRAALGALGVETPSHVQALSYRPVLSGADALVADQTGSGKTLAYLAPIVQAPHSDCHAAL